MFFFFFFGSTYVHFSFCFFFSTGRNGNLSILAFPHVKNLPNKNYVELKTAKGWGSSDKRTMSDAIRLRVVIPAHMDRTCVSLSAHFQLIHQHPLEATKAAATTTPASTGTLPRSPLLLSSVMDGGGGGDGIGGVEEVVELLPATRSTWKYTGGVGRHRGKVRVCFFIFFFI